MNWSNEWDAINPATGEVEINLIDGPHVGTLVGDLVLYNDWGSWKVAHYPTQSKFDKAVPDVNGGVVVFETSAPAYTKEQLLSWCDRVQCKHGVFWAVLRELTPDDYLDNDSERVIKAKRIIQDWCLSVPVVE